MADDLFVFGSLGQPPFGLAAELPPYRWLLSQISPYFTHLCCLTQTHCGKMNIEIIPPYWGLLCQISPYFTHLSCLTQTHCGQINIEIIYNFLSSRDSQSSSQYNWRNLNSSLIYSCDLVGCSGCFEDLRHFSDLLAISQLGSGRLPIWNCSGDSGNQT